MNLFEAKKLTLDLMSNHNLTHWKFKWHNRKTTFGICYYTRETIGLSQILIPKMSVEEVTNTILHEIAHALVGVGYGHNYVWQRKAIEIGCDGNRTADYGIVVESKYVATCKGCGKKIGAHRKPKRKHWCLCDNRRFEPEMELNYVQQY